MIKQCQYFEELSAVFYNRKAGQHKPG